MWTSTDGVTWQPLDCQAQDRGYFPPPAAMSSRPDLGSIGRASAKTGGSRRDRDDPPTVIEWGEAVPKELDDENGTRERREGLLAPPGVLAMLGGCASTATPLLAPPSARRHWSCRRPLPSAAAGISSPSPTPCSDPATKATSRPSTPTPPASSATSASTVTVHGYWLGGCTSDLSSDRSRPTSVLRAEIANADAIVFEVPVGEFRIECPFDNAEWHPLPGTPTEWRTCAARVVARNAANAGRIIDAITALRSPADALILPSNLWESGFRDNLGRGSSPRCTTCIPRPTRPWQRPRRATVSPLPTPGPPSWGPTARPTPSRPDPPGRHGPPHPAGGDHPRGPVAQSRLREGTSGGQPPGRVAVIARPLPGAQREAPSLGATGSPAASPGASGAAPDGLVYLHRDDRRPARQRHRALVRAAPGNVRSAGGHRTAGSRDSWETDDCADWPPRDLRAARTPRAACPAGAVCSRSPQ